MTQDEQICSLALTRIPGLGLTGAFRLVSSLGSATRVFEHRKELSQLVPGVSEKIITALNNSEAFRRAEQELTFCEKNHIRCLTLNDEGYPGRLRECDDAPLALFYRGNADLNALHVINMVGTRHATPYGQDICTRFLADLSVLCPNALIVSGLAYGIDIHAHRAALQNHFKTIGVLAHRTGPYLSCRTSEDSRQHVGTGRFADRIYKRNQSRQAEFRETKPHCGRYE